MENKSKIKVKTKAASGLSRVIYHPIEKDESFKLVSKKGESYADFNLSFPFVHQKKYRENIYKYNLFSATHIYYGEKELLEKYHVLIKNGEVYKKPYITLVYLDGQKGYEYFNDEETAYARFEELKNKFNLIDF